MAGYPSNFLKTVIIRADFTSPVPAINTSLPKNVTDMISKYFSIAEPRTFSGEITFTPTGIDKNEKTGTDWFFFGKQREKELAITINAMFIKLKIYKSYEDLKEQFQNISEMLFTAFPDIQIRRVGLRYVNHIELSGQNPFEWKIYINKNLLSIFNIEEDKKKIIRALSTIETTHNDSFRLRFNYGMHNPDYPAIIKKKVFLLDFDAFSEGFFNKDEMIRNIDIFHEEIERKFEFSITNNLRKKMEK